MNSVFVKVDDAAYHVKVSGSGAPIVVLHGFTGSAESWDRFASEMSSDFQVIAIDLPGHGQTQAPLNRHYFSMEKVCLAIRDILSFLKIDQAAFLGYSMGGRTALAYAAIYPQSVTSLILESASPGLKTVNERADRRQSDAELASFIENEGIKRFTERWERIPLFVSQKQLSEEKRMEIREGRLQNSAEGLAASLRYMGTGSQPSYWDALGKLNKTVLLLTGEWDHKFIRIAMEMEKLLPNAVHENILHSGHAIQVEQPEKFDTIVKEFLFKNSTT
ncbi:2-succinyl-6-hydroxy-2,4-cyclohexadiene-1-carboxylate synthase [Jeotgalibacillus terrae]|uniref:Putative 2-succinyl-6-hydroxy-2,4-cyclohexadiene-1-carboxylate synthase n=1 Tax=Jeotgalibacillus terrae TaxID=587735 RepID=A0ABW5ZHU9_9BACL|nr:2-succinyl-6-hydroxy-2,4-cyclohexadiene-1-carboxylate synthase [Jeotgalibacillus terrae]